MVRARRRLPARIGDLVPIEGDHPAAFRRRSGCRACRPPRVTAAFHAAAPVQRPERAARVDLPAPLPPTMAILVSRRSGQWSMRFARAAGRDRLEKRKRLRGVLASGSAVRSRFEGRLSTGVPSRASGTCHARPPRPFADPRHRPRSRIGWIIRPTAAMAPAASAAAACRCCSAIKETDWPRQ